MSIPSNQSPGPPPARAAQWRLAEKTLSIGRIPLLMGIVNVTPDSFSDGGRFLEVGAAVEHGLRLAEQGADILDVGGESTRPYATPIDADEELRRVIPVVAALCEQSPVPISIDTSKAAVAREALQAGAQVVNDVTGLTDPGMVEVAIQAGAGVCAMHIRGTPQTMQDDPVYEDVVGEVTEYLCERRDALRAAGIRQQQIALDPGIGFGKTLSHNLDLLAGVGRLHGLGCPILVGPSRKGFIRQVLGDPQADRTAGTIGVCLALAQRGVQILRVHDLNAVRQALLLWVAAGGANE